MRRAFDILRDAYRHSGYRLVALLVLLCVVGISDGISMALLYPLLEMVGMGGRADTGSGVLGAAFQWIFAQLGIEPTLASVSMIVIGSFLVQALLFTAQNWLLIDVQKKYINSWQQKLFSDFIGADWPYFASQKTGEMTSGILVEAVRLGAALFAVLQLIVAAVVVCIYLAISLLVSWKVTLYLLAAALVMFVLVRPIRQATRRYGEQAGPINNDLASALHEMFTGAKLIKASASEAKAKALVFEHLDRLRNNLTWGAFLPSTVRGGFEFAAILMILGALVYGMKVEQISAAQLLVVIALVARLFPRLMHIQQFHSSLNLYAPAYSVMHRIHERTSAHAEARRAGEGARVDPSLIWPAAISARNLVVRYEDKTVLDDVSFTIPPGQVVGFVGPSGAGKSTLVDVVLGLIEPSGGSITVGDVPLQDLDLFAWRRRIGYVSQDTFLFHDTIANNIRWGATDISAQAAAAAARTTGLDAFARDLDRGYETIVGDRGVKLSGGQRQRVSLARALARQPALLVLDEATSALDSLSEQEVMRVLQDLKGKTTVVIVAHRLATVLNADLIYVLDQGRIVEQGSWACLSRQKALFHRLMEAQAIGADGHG